MHPGLCTSRGQTHCHQAGTCNVKAGILIVARSGPRTLPMPNALRNNLTYCRTTTSRRVPHLEMGQQVMLTERLSRTDKHVQHISGGDGSEPMSRLRVSSEVFQDLSAVEVSHLAHHSTTFITPCFNPRFFVSHSHPNVDPISQETRLIPRARTC